MRRIQEVIINSVSSSSRFADRVRRGDGHRIQWAVSPRGKEVSRQGTRRGVWSASSRRAAPWNELHLHDARRRSGITFDPETWRAGPYERRRVGAKRPAEGRAWSKTPWPMALHVDCRSLEAPHKTTCRVGTICGEHPPRFDRLLAHEL